MDTGNISRDLCADKGCIYGEREADYKKTFGAHISNTKLPKAKRNRTANGGQSMDCQKPSSYLAHLWGLATGGRQRVYAIWRGLQTNWVWKIQGKLQFCGLVFPSSTAVRLDVLRERLRRSLDCVAALTRILRKTVREFYEALFFWLT